MHIAPFETEQFFSLYEFSTPHLLSVSDCETVTVDELLALAGLSQEAFGQLRLGYTESQGHPELRAAIAEGYHDVAPDDVVVLTSPVEGIYLTMQTLLEPGDEAIVLMPAYDSLFNMAQHVCGRAHRWELVPTKAGWRMDLDALERLISPKTKLIVVNFPHNPTGFLPSVEQLGDVVALARRRGAWLMCDEMYRGLENDSSQRLPSAASLYERSIVLSGLSKAHGLPGLRSGWLILRDLATRDALVNWKHYTTICPPAPSEWLALAGLKAADTLIERNRQIISENLALAHAFFERCSDLIAWRPPQAGSVALVGVDVPSATDYCHALARDAGVLLLPGACMGAGDQTVRFGFGRRSFPEALAAYESHLERHGLR